MAHLRGPQRARYVARMFGRISHRYDRLNTVMTAGRHYRWRRMAAGIAAEGLQGDALDVATGTGDFAIELARTRGIREVVGIDFATEMLPIAERKTRQNDLAGRVRYLMGDAHALPFDDGLFACATVGFGVRNFVDVPRALREMARVVKPSGRVVILEIVRLDGRGLLSRAFPLYFRFVTPWLGTALADDREAYTYLPESVQGFLSADELATMMEQAGLFNITVRKVALGSVAILTGENPGG